MQAHHELENVGRQERKRIVFTEIPYQVNKANLVARIADLIKQRKLDGASEVRDESDRKGMRIVIELRRSAAPAVILNNLYRHTPLRTSFSVNMVALVNDIPRVVTLKSALRHYIEFREEIVQAEGRVRAAQGPSPRPRARGPQDRHRQPGPRNHHNSRFRRRGDGQEQPDG